MRIQWSLLSSPVFVASVALLLLNDHLLKSMWPGLVTGKLSDIAGVAMVAIALTALTGRPTPAAVATAIAFALLKTAPQVAEFLAPVLGGRTRTDPTDLVALAVLLPVWRLAGKRQVTTSRSAWAVPVRVTVVGAAVFATTATSCADEGVAGLAVAPDGTIVTDSYPTYVSRDGGLSWTEEVTDWPGRDGGRCFEDGVCVTLETGDGATIESTDGTVRLDRAASEVAGLDALGRPSCFASVLGDVVVVDAEGVEYVVVAMGWLGVLRAERGGAFEWSAVGPWGIQERDAAFRPLGLEVATPVSNADGGFALPVAVATAFMAIAWLLVPASIFPLRRIALRKGRSPTPVAVFAALAAVALGAVGVFLLLLMAVFESTPSVRTWLASVFAAVNVIVAGAMFLVQGLVLGRSTSLPPPEGADRVD